MLNYYELKFVIKDKSGVLKNSETRREVKNFADGVQFVEEITAEMIQAQWVDTRPPYLIGGTIIKTERGLLLETKTLIKPVT